MVALVLASAAGHVADLRAVETVSIPPARGLPNYRLVVEGSDASDQDETRRLVIFSAGHRTVVSVEGGLAANQLPANKLHSKFIFRSRSMPDNMVIVFGWTYDTGPAELRVIRLGRVPEQILAEQEFHLDHVQRGANGRSLLIIGKRTFSEMLGNCISTYDPYSVLKLDDMSRGHFHYSLALSKWYNTAHYGGWAGPKSREDLGVNVCRTHARLVRL